MTTFRVRANDEIPIANSVARPLHVQPDVLSRSLRRARSRAWLQAVERSESKGKSNGAMTLRAIDEHAILNALTACRHPCGERVRTSRQSRRSNVTAN